MDVDRSQQVENSNHQSQLAPETQPEPQKQKLRPSILSAALAYHALGLRVVILHNKLVAGGCSCRAGKSCDGIGKHPRMSGWNKPGHGMLTTADEIKDAFKRYPRANLGIITGGEQYSNLICIDVDPKHGGEESLSALIAANAPFPPTWQARTGSGGSHYLFKHPGSAWIVRNSQADDKKHHPKLGTGLDVKGDRGQFVAPPSLHASGNLYEWVNAPGGPVELAELPEWLLKLIAEPAGGKKTRSSLTSSSTSTSSRASNARRERARIQSWARKALEEECARVINAPPGTGNDALNTAAFNLGQIVGGGSLDEDEARSALFEAATANGRRPELEAAKSIASGLNSGKGQPRMPPEQTLDAVSTKNNSSQHNNNNNSNNSHGHQPGQPEINEIEEHDDDPHRLARAFIDQFGTYQGKQRLWKWREEWYNWGALSKCYREVPKSEIKDQLCGFIKKEFDSIAESSGEKSRKVSAEIVNNTLNALSSLCLLKTGNVRSIPSWLGTGKCPNFIPVANGLIDCDAIETAESAADLLKPHTPEWFSVDVLPAPFSEMADCPKWKAFLERNLEADKDRIMMLQEWFGYCLTPDTGFQKFLILNGEGANGKSVICAALTALLGLENISTVPLEMFGERFQLTSTLGKLANIVADVGDLDRAAEGQLKSFVAGDVMHFDRKGKSPIMAQPTARLVLATNNLPRFNDKSSGLWRRMLLIPLEAVIQESERVPNMDKSKWWHDQNEVSGMLNWALAGRDRLYRQNAFTKPAVCEKALEEYRVDVNPVRRFFEEEITIAEGAWSSTKAIYAAYSKWCKEAGYKPMSNGSLGREIVRHSLRCNEWKGVVAKRGFDGARRLCGYDQIQIYDH